MDKHQLKPQLRDGFTIPRCLSSDHLQVVRGLVTPIRNLRHALWTLSAGWPSILQETRSFLLDQLFIPLKSNCLSVSFDSVGPLSQQNGGSANHTLPQFLNSPSFIFSFPFFRSCFQLASTSLNPYLISQFSSSSSQFQSSDCRLSPWENHFSFWEIWSLFELF